jgi:hypothetical protein
MSASRVAALTGASHLAQLLHSFRDLASSQLAKEPPEAKGAQRRHQSAQAGRGGREREDSSGGEGHANHSTPGRGQPGSSVQRLPRQPRGISAVEWRHFRRAAGTSGFRLPARSWSVGGRLEAVLVRRTPGRGERGSRGSRGSGRGGGGGGVAGPGVRGAVGAGPGTWTGACPAPGPRRGWLRTRARLPGLYRPARPSGHWSPAGRQRRV